MDTNPKFLGGMTRERFERMAVGVKASRLAADAKLDPSKLSKYERGLVRLTPAEEARRRSVLELLAGEPQAAAS